MATPPSHTGQVLHTGCDNQVIDQSYSKILAALPDSDRALQVLFGRSRISVRPVLNQNNASAEFDCQKIVDEVRKFSRDVEQFDDISMVLIKTGTT